MVVLRPAFTENQYEVAVGTGGGGWGGGGLVLNYLRNPEVNLSVLHVSFCPSHYG